MISQEIFRIPYSISGAEALEIDNHEDIVSIIVEEQVFKKMQADIEQYASRVQSVLPHTRATILTFPENTHPLLIASANERLYYSGLPNHGKKTQKLVGTILIGNISLPTVHNNSQSFLSIYPYIDFDEPHFAWNWGENKYSYLAVERKNVQPELWHSVIAPHTWSITEDVKKIKNFFQRVYDYDNKKWVYADVGKDPQVLYADSERDARATSPGSLAAYEELFVPNQEHFSYNRYTKEFAQYLYENYLSLMKSAGTNSVASFSDWRLKKVSATPASPFTLDTLDESAIGSASFLSTASDISTHFFSRELIPGFLKTLSEKYVGDVARWIHQSGRYYDWYSRVRADTVPELIQQRDALSTQILRQANDSFEKLVNEYIEGSLSVDIPVLVKREDSSRSKLFTYTNYFFGKKANTLWDASECSLVRGSTFGGKNSAAEMNHGYHLQSVENDIAKITKDAEDKISCSDRVSSYWGWNSPMNIDFSSGVPELKKHTYNDFSQPIYDPAWGKKTSKTASPFDCLETDLLLEPYRHRVPIFSGYKEYEWPRETDGRRYSCGTDFNTKTEYFSLDPSPETNENIFTVLTACQWKWNTKLLWRDGKELTTCASQWAGGTYKLISSLIQHISPDNETFGKQLVSLASPNLPVDENRYVVYIDRDLKERQINYPNMYDIQFPIDATEALIQQKIQQYLDVFEKKMQPWKTVSDMGVFSFLVPKSGNKKSLSLSTIVSSSPDLEANLVASLRWKNLPTAMKYQQSITDSLQGNKSRKVAMFADAKRNYEIAFLWWQGDAKNFIVGYNPQENSENPSWYQTILDVQGNYEELQNSSSVRPNTFSDDFSLSLKDYNDILGSNALPKNNETDKKGTECVDENAVPIWEWLSAIQCWLKNLFTTEWEPGITDFSFDWSPYLSLTFWNHTLYTTEKTTSITQVDKNNNRINDSVESEASLLTLKNVVTNYVLKPQSTVMVESYLEKNTTVIWDDISEIQLVPLRIADLDSGEVFISQSKKWQKILSESLSIAWSPVLKDGKATWTVRSTSPRPLSIEFETRIQTWKNVLVRSVPFTLVPVSKFPPFTLLSSKESMAPRTIRADDATWLQIQFSGDTTPAKVDIEIRDAITGNSVFSSSSVPVVNQVLKIGSPAGDVVLRKAWKYIMTLTSQGVSETIDFFIIAWAPKKIVSNMPSVVVTWEKYSIQFILQDNWWNNIAPESWSVMLRASQPVLFWIDKKSTRDTSFSLASRLQFQPIKEETITFDITAKNIESSLQQSMTTSAVSEIVIESTLTRAQVGEKLPVEFVIKTLKGVVITQWNSPMNIMVKGTGAKLENSLITFTGGKWRGVLNIGTQSGTASFYSSDILVGKKIGSDIIINPGAPHRMTFTGPETLLARKGSSQILEIHIFDIFGNYIHPATVDVRVEGDRADLLDPFGKVQRIEWDTYWVRLSSLGYPGRVLLRGSVWNNDIKSKKATLENVWKVQILPVITGQDIVENTWNALTYILLGGPFGQFVTSGYFAGNLLFSPDTQALSVSTLVDTPHSGIFSLTNTWIVTLWDSPRLGAWLQSFVQPDSRWLFTLVVSDKRLWDIAKITYPQLSDTDRNSFIPTHPDATFVGDTIFYKWIPVTSLTQIFQLPSVSLRSVSSAMTLRFSVSYKWMILGMYDISYTSRIPSSDGWRQNTFSIETYKSNLFIKSAWWSISSSDWGGIVVTESDISSMFSWGPVSEGFSSYPGKYGMWWTGNNLGLLEFASGNNWAHSHKNFADYVTINLWDPLIHLPQYKVNNSTGFDATIGYPIYKGITGISSFSFSDTNNDWQKDLLVVDDANTLSAALSRKNGTFVSMGEILSLSQGKEWSIRTGDFFWDGYADSAYIDNQGILRLVSQEINGFSDEEIISDRRQDLGQITQMEVFDMDRDKRDDIVVMDNLGQLSVFYWTSEKKFIYHFVDNAYDFDFAKQSLFTGAIHYKYLGFSFPDFSKTQDPILRSQQEQLQSVLFIPLSLSSPLMSDSPSPTAIGAQIDSSFTVDPSAGSGNALKNIGREYAALSEQYGSSFTLKKWADTIRNFSLIKAPFIDSSKIVISKKYQSLEKNGNIIPWAVIQGTISLKNISPDTLTQVIIAEVFPSYLEGPIIQYSLKQWSQIAQKAFLDSSEWWIADLRDISIAPWETIEITYTAKFATFSFGNMSVGYLEDKQDPLMNTTITKDRILTIHSDASKLKSIPERDFFWPEKYWDIRINPNNTCGGPLFLWRSHNTFARTYQKTLIVRNIENPDTSTMNISNDPLNNMPSSGWAQEIATLLASGSSPQDIQKIQKNYAETAKKDLANYNKDTDSDAIPDRYDENTGDIFTIENSGNSTQISVGLGKLDEAIDQAIEWVETFMSGLSCGFGDAGCIAQPINWTANVPGNTITALGYAVPGINRAPLACYRDVRCGVPLFSFPTASPPYFWPPNPHQWGGAFDVGAGWGILTQNTTFTGGYGTSQFRFFLWATLTGAIAEVACFGPNNLANPAINLPWLFPMSFQGNCIFATQPLTQCSDDGTNDIVTELEMDTAFDLDSSLSLTDGDSCWFFEPVKKYPDDLIKVSSNYLLNPSSRNLELLRMQLSENASLVTGKYVGDNSLLFASPTPYDTIEPTTKNASISYPDSGNGGTGIIRIALDSTSFDVTRTWPIFDIKLKSIAAFPRFIMDWYHRQLDEIVSSFSSLPDIKIFLPDLGSGFADAGWTSQFNAWSSFSNPSSIASRDNDTTFISAVWDSLDTVSQARDTVVWWLQEGIGGIQAVFEYLSLLPMINVHPEVLSYSLPWIDRSAAQSWIYRNEAILAQWEALPQNALANAVNYQPVISSIRSNIETVKTYMTLPEQLQNLFFIKEKLLYEILKNVSAIQGLMWGWIYDNGQRFKTWVETFILVTKIWDLWQILIDVFTDYEQSCAVCHNEQWNLQEWLWIVISAIIPPIPVITMPRWPDIELDFSDLDLGIDIAYPVFNFSFYPLALPDMPTPSFNGLTLPPIPQLPPLPDLHLDFELPTIILPKLPNLPPAPMVPEFSQSIAVVLKIFKIVTLIQCLYRKVPLSPEWYVGTKIAHQTDRQGYLPIDFLNVQMPSVAVKWIDAIRVSSHVKLTYDIDFIIEMIRSALQPLADFPRDLSFPTDKIPSSVDIDLDNKDSSIIQTSSIEDLPTLIGRLYQETLNPKMVDLNKEITSLNKIADTTVVTRNLVTTLPGVDTSMYSQSLSERVKLLTDALKSDIQDNRVLIADLSQITTEKRELSEIAWIQNMDPTVSHLAASQSQPVSALLDVMKSWKNILTNLPTTATSLVSNSISPPAATVIPPKTETKVLPTSTVSTRKQNSTQLKQSKWLYITKNGISQRLNYFYENQSDTPFLTMIDDDKDGDKDIFYVIWNTVYRKENYTKSLKKIYITDSPQIFNVASMMQEFFNLSATRLEQIPRDGQVFLRNSHTPSAIAAQYLLDTKTSHTQFDIYTTWWQTDPKKAAYRVDSVWMPELPWTQGYSIMKQPLLLSGSWKVKIYRKKIYRTLFPSGKYRDGESGTLQDLPLDFVIRAKKTGYTQERTSLQILFSNQKKEIILEAWDRLIFSQNSNIIIKSWSLILSGDDYEQKTFTRLDINMPLFVGDIIETGDNGNASVLFSDETKTQIYPNQKWSLVSHSGSEKVLETFSLPVLPDWYYVSSHDAGSLWSNRAPQFTLFDAYTNWTIGQLADTLPTSLPLRFDTPTEIDFSIYFPLEWVAKVEVSGLSESFWKQISATKILFQTSQENVLFTLRVTNKKWIISTYPLTLETKPATLAIQQVDSKNNISGTLSESTTLPITIQSYIDGKPWTISTPITSAENKFTTSFLDITPEWSISYNNKKAFSMKRDRINIAPQEGIIFSPVITVGQPIQVIASLNQMQIANISYYTNDLFFQQISTKESLQKNTLSLISTQLRLEPSLDTDMSLKWGAYLVDAQYQPVLALDNRWIIRYLDKNISFKVFYEWEVLILSLTRWRDDLGSLLLSGDALSYWDK